MENLPDNSKNSTEILHKILPLLLVAFIVIRIIFALLTPRPAALASDLTVENILQAINQQRSQRNLVTLNTDTRLSGAGQSKADDMQSRHYFAHVDPEGNYVWPKIVAAGYTPYLQLGENLAIEFYDTESLVAAWMNSPTHRANILNDGFKDQGMGLNFGDSNAGQYHSVVANTFGSLLLKKVQAAQAVAPTPSPTQSFAPTPTPVQKPKPNTTPKTIPTPTPSPKPTATDDEIPASPLSPRGNYAMAEHPTAAEPSSSPQPPSASTKAVPKTSSPAVINPASVNETKNFQFSRYFTLAFGIVLFLFLITDLHGLEEGQLHLASKKASSLVLLFMALVVIAVMYWL